MNYYIQGDAANADKIRAAFKKLGIDVLDFGFADKTLVYCSIGGCVQPLPYSINLMHILYNHPDYKELELPIEPKFKVGDWIIRNNRSSYVPIQIYNLKKDTYLVTNTLGSKGEAMLTCQDKWHLWTIADARDGDVITNGKLIVIFNKLEEPAYRQHIIAYIGLDLCGKLQITEDTWQLGVDKAMPATKEQRDLLFAKMKEAGYEWDEKKKELHKIKHYAIANFKPKQWVLVRDDDEWEWALTRFSYLSNGSASLFVCINGASFQQCIPFEGNEHLLGTTDPCDEKYINW